MSSIKRNLGYQTLYQVIMTALPIVTAPYLARVLGANQLGIYSYTLSVANYFVLFSLLGIEKYGTRSIASVRGNFQERSRVFCGIYAMQLCTTLVCTAAYAAYILFFCRENRLIALIQSVEILAAFINVNWLYYGLEQFKATVTRSLIVKLASTAAILILVKTPDDLWIYTLIVLGSNCLCNALLWSRVPRMVAFTRVSTREILCHIKPNIVLFIPIAAMSIYHIMDKTMLGIISDYENSGYYYSADKIINIPMGIISGFSTVILPRFSSLVSENRMNEYRRLFSRSLQTTCAFACYVAFGISAVAREFVPFFFGAGYSPCVALIQVLSSVILIKTISFTIRYQYLIPCKKEKYYISSVVVGAGINLVVNLLLIPKTGAMGAAIGTLAAELAACLLQVRCAQAEFSVARDLFRCLPYMGIGAVIFAVVRGTAMFLAGQPVIAVLLAETGLGVLAGCGLTAVFWKLTGNPLAKEILRGLRRKKSDFHIRG